MTRRKAYPPVDPCPECGEPHVRQNGTPSCIRHSNGRLRPEIKGKPCRQPQMTGQLVCKNHGGLSPQAMAKAEERVTQQQVEALAATFGRPEEGKDPGDIVAEQIDWRYGHVQWLRSRVQALDPTALTWGRTKKKVGGDDHGKTFEAKANVWLQMYLEAETALEKLCLEAIRAGLEERRVRLAESQADVLVRFIDGVLTDLGFDPTEPETAGVVERHLRAVG